MAELDEKAIYARGFDVGEEKGRQEGREEGIQERNIQIAKELLKEGFSTEKISTITGLTEEEIKTIK